MEYTKKKNMLNYGIEPFHLLAVLVLEKYNPEILFIIIVVRFITLNFMSMSDIMHKIIFVKYQLHLIISIIIY